MRHPPALGVLVVAWLALTPTPAQALDQTTLSAALQREASRLGPAAGAYVVDLDRAQAIYARNPDIRLAPASNQKLFTTAAALLMFGPEATRTTRVVASAAPDPAGVVNGDLFLVGAGDPALSTTNLQSIADTVRNAGITRVTGSVLGDESFLDTRRGSYNSGFRADFELGGQLGALTIAHGGADAHGPASLAAAKLQAYLGSRKVAFGRKAGLGVAPDLATAVAE